MILKVNCPKICLILKVICPDIGLILKVTCPEISLILEVTFPEINQIFKVRGGIKKKKLVFFRKTPKGGGRGLAESKIF